MASRKKVSTKTLLKRSRDALTKAIAALPKSGGRKKKRRK